MYICQSQLAKSSHSSPSLWLSLYLFSMSVSCLQMTTDQVYPNSGDSSSPVLEARRLRSGCPRAELPAESPGEGPSRLVQLLGAPGVHPWAGGRLRPVPASVSTWLLLCVPVSPLLCLIRTLSVALGPPPVQEEPHLRPSLHHVCRDPLSK